MPMLIESLDQYDKVVNVSWYMPENNREDLKQVNHDVLPRGCTNAVATAFLACYRSLRCTLCAVSTLETF